jgi:hypothetical protein
MRAEETADYLSAARQGRRFKSSKVCDEWEVLKTRPKGTDDVVEFSSPSKAAADNALRELIERDYPGLLAQHGGMWR